MFDDDEKEEEEENLTTFLRDGSRSVSFWVFLDLLSHIRFESKVLQNSPRFKPFWTRE